MRAWLILVLFPATAAFAQIGAPNYAPAAPQSTFTLGVQSFGPTLTGHLQGAYDGQPMLVDLNGDLGMGKDKTHTGLFFDYQSQSYALQLSTGSAEYAGNQVTPSPVAVNGAVYQGGDLVQSWAKFSTLDGVFTLKLGGQPDAWIGLDLGLQSWTLDLQTSDASVVAPLPSSSSVSLKMLVPEVGLSGGSRAYNGAFESKAYIRYMNARGGKYILLGTDLRMFITRWLGVRAFYESGRLVAPSGSLKDGLEIGLDRKGAGFGAVLRF